MRSKVTLMDDKLADVPMADPLRRTGESQSPKPFSMDTDYSADDRE